MLEFISWYLDDGLLYIIVSFAPYNNVEEAPQEVFFSFDVVAIPFIYQEINEWTMNNEQHVFFYKIYNISFYKMLHIYIYIYIYIIYIYVYTYIYIYISHMFIYY